MLPAKLKENNVVAPPYRVRLRPRHEHGGRVRAVERHDENLAVRAAGGQEVGRGLVWVKVETRHRARVPLHGRDLQQQHQ